MKATFKNHWGSWVFIFGATAATLAKIDTPELDADRGVQAALLDVFCVLLFSACAILFLIPRVRAWMFAFGAMGCLLGIVRLAGLVTDKHYPGVMVTVSCALLFIACGSLVYAGLPRIVRYRRIIETRARR